MNTDYTYLTVTATDANTLTCTVANSGGTSGSAGAYIPAFKASSFTEAGVTIASPNAGNCQINSINIVTGSKSTSTFLLILPASISNGAGANSSLVNQNPPISQAFKLSDGAQNTSAVVTLNTSSNFNRFSISGLTTLVNNMIRVTF